MDQNVAGLLSYLVGWITGLIFFLVEKDNKFVKFHAMQSILVFGSLSALSLVVSVLRGILVAIFYRTAGLYLAHTIISGLFGLISTVIWLATVVLWILLMIKAYQNETFKVPIFGNIAEKQLQ